MKKLKSLFLMLLIAVTGSIAITILVMPMGGQEQGPMWSQWESPTNGIVIRGTNLGSGWTGDTNVILSVRASSSVAPVIRVEWYRDGVLFSTWTNTFPPPGGLRTSP